MSLSAARPSPHITMPHRAMFRNHHVPSDAAEARRLAALDMAAALRAGRCPTDRAFDRFLPDDLRGVSGHYWTPVAAAKRAAEWLNDLKIRTVVDIGSGAGKFCVVAALVGQCRVTGLEQRRSLVASARALVQLFELRDRVSFVHGALGAMATPSADAYYLYNPFGHYFFGPDHADPSVESSVTRQAQDVATVEALLRQAPIGTYVVTYNGFGGRGPATYTLIRVDDTLPNPLTLWRKERNTPRRDLVRRRPSLGFV